MSTQTKGYRFRVGERRLLSWLQEDEVRLEDDGDDFVNGRASPPGSPTEDMPLTPSPRPAQFARNYGTASQTHTQTQGGYYGQSPR